MLATIFLFSFVVSGSRRKSWNARQLINLFYFYFWVLFEENPYCYTHSLRITLLEIIVILYELFIPELNMNKLEIITMNMNCFLLIFFGRTECNLKNIRWDIGGRRKQTSTTYWKQTIRFQKALAYRSTSAKERAIINTP